MARGALRSRLLRRESGAGGSRVAVTSSPGWCCDDVVVVPGRGAGRSWSGWPTGSLAGGSRDRYFATLSVSSQYCLDQIEWAAYSGGAQGEQGGGPVPSLASEAIGIVPAADGVESGAFEEQLPVEMLQDDGTDNAVERTAEVIRAGETLGEVAREDAVAQLRVVRSSISAPRGDSVPRAGLLVFREFDLHRPHLALRSS